MAIAIVGGNWGDEGKGKITDYLAQNAKSVVRFQGGKNAGHTIINEYGKFALHLLPSGVFHRDITNILGCGVAVDIKAFFDELNEVKSRTNLDPKVYISERAQIVMPYHILLDQYEEDRLKDQKFGSTKSGIAPFYGDKYLKIGIQMRDLWDPDLLRKKIERAIDLKNVLFEHVYKKEKLRTADLLEYLLQFTDDSYNLKWIVKDTERLLRQPAYGSKKILLEGQLGALRDPNLGIYPYSTSSSTLAGYATIGAGIPVRELTSIIAVVKAYSTCVGAGPFVTEWHGDDAETLRRIGGDNGEYGATTGRPRRVGAFDSVASRYGCEIQGATEVALTLLDVIGLYPQIPICVEYRLKSGQTTPWFPTTDELWDAEPVYEYMEGWPEYDISGARWFSDLPLAAKKYVKRIEELIGLPVTLISVGPRREQIVQSEKRKVPVLQ